MGPESKRLPGATVSQFGQVLAWPGMKPLQLVQVFNDDMGFLLVIQYYSQREHESCQLSRISEK
tara:strand:- start:290 stop:481 length:192 start_codon:yes stop_codon:yes gene_type:complete